MNRISNKGVIGLVIAAVCFVASIFFPWWAMRLVAPQYREGLYIWVYPYKMTGQIDIINGLNHYIGMKEFSEASFPELTYLPYIIGALAIITFIVAFVKSRKLLLGWIGIVLIGALLGLFDIYRWLRSYGTELDPKAPIDMDPFVPPVFGHNKLANFTTFSFFSYGALFAGIAILLLILVYWKGKEE